MIEACDVFRFIGMVENETGADIEVSIMKNDALIIKAYRGMSSRRFYFSVPEIAEVSYDTTQMIIDVINKKFPQREDGLK